MWPMWVVTGALVAFTVMLVFRFAAKRRSLRFLQAAVCFVVAAASTIAAAMMQEDADQKRASLDRFAVETKGRLVCMENLSRLASIYANRSRTKPWDPETPGGVGFLISWCKTHDLVARGDERLLRCPGDKELRAFERAGADAFAAASPSNPPLDLCSYAVRDFMKYPVPADSAEREILFCCRQGANGRTAHHINGIYVAFTDGHVRFMDRDELGFHMDEPITVGPESSNAMLKMVCLVPAK